MESRDPYYRLRDPELGNGTGKRIAKLLARVAETEEGREAIDEILSLCGLEATCFTPDAVAMAYAAGRQSIGLELVRMLKPEDYLTILKERNERRERDRYGSGSAGSVSHGCWQSGRDSS